MNLSILDDLPAVDGWRFARPDVAKAKAKAKAKSEAPVTLRTKRDATGLVLTVSISAEMHAKLKGSATLAVSENPTESALMLQPCPAEMAEAFPLRKHDAKGQGRKAKASRRQLSLPAWSNMLETDGVTPASSRLITWMGHPALVIRLPLAIFEPRKASR